MSVLSFVTLAGRKLGCLVLVRGFLTLLEYRSQTFCLIRKDYLVQPAYFTWRNGVMEKGQLIPVQHAFFSPPLVSQTVLNLNAHRAGLIKRVKWAHLCLSKEWWTLLPHRNMLYMLFSFFFFFLKSLLLVYLFFSQYWYKENVFCFKTTRKEDWKSMVKALGHMLGNNGDHLRGQWCCYMPARWWGPSIGESSGFLRKMGNLNSYTNSSFT